MDNKYQQMKSIVDHIKGKDALPRGFLKGKKPPPRVRPTYQVILFRMCTNYKAPRITSSL